MFNADLALSVTMTAISTLLSTVFLPLNLLLYTRFAYEDDVIQNLDWTSLFIALVIVLSAISLGLLCSWKVRSHKFNLMANQVRFSHKCICVVVCCVVGVDQFAFTHHPPPTPVSSETLQELHSSFSLPP